MVLSCQPFETGSLILRCDTGAQASRESPGSIYHPVLGSLKLQTRSDMLGFLHVCWGFELTSSCWYNKSRYLLAFSPSSNLLKKINILITDNNGFITRYISIPSCFSWYLTSQLVSCLLLYLLAFGSSSTRPFLGEIFYSVQCLKGKYKQRTLQMQKIFVVILFVAIETRERLPLPKVCHRLSWAGPPAAGSGRAHSPEWRANSTVSELCLG